MIIVRIFIICCIVVGLYSLEQPHHHHHRHYHKPISTSMLSGDFNGCAFSLPYYVHQNVEFPMCIGQTVQETKNGRSIIEMIKARGFNPTCRVQHLLLWMYATAGELITKDNSYFVDVGANIGSCSNHMAALGLPVVAVEPTPEHIAAIQGTLALNPSFRIEHHRIGMSAVARNISGKFVHAGQNWGSSYFNETDGGETLELQTLDKILGRRHAVLLKVDCEGCEYATILGAEKAFNNGNIDMMKIEINLEQYEASAADGGTVVVKTKEFLRLIESYGFELFGDVYREEHLYFGKLSKEIVPIDRIFGSFKLKVPGTSEALYSAAATILKTTIDMNAFTTASDFNAIGTDIIAIKSSIAAKMKKIFLN